MWLVYLSHYTPAGMACSSEFCQAHLSKLTLGDNNCKFYYAVSLLDQRTIIEFTTINTLVFVSYALLRFLNLRKGRYLRRRRRLATIVFRRWPWPWPVSDMRARCSCLCFGWPWVGPPITTFSKLSAPGFFLLCNLLLCFSWFATMKYRSAPVVVKFALDIICNVNSIHKA